MRPVHILILVCLVVPLASCIQRVEQKPTPRNTEVTDLLKRMVEEDQELRLNDTIDWRVVVEADLNHRQAVYDLLVKAKIEQPQDLYRAAQILQHADPSSCAECYLLAHYLSQRAVQLGYEPARYLTAATLDRYLLFTGQPQKFGTQYNMDSLGHHYLYPVDSLTSDSERAVWEVPSLDSLKARIDRLNAENRPSSGTD